MDTVMEKRLDAGDFLSMFGTWAGYFEKLFEGKYGEQMFDLYQWLKEKAGTERVWDNKSGEWKSGVFPHSENVFRAFEKCNPNPISCVVMGMEPYSGAYRDFVPQATGISLDCSNSPDKTLQPSLRKFHEGIARDIGEKEEYAHDLGYLCEQGVLLVNRSLTVSHRKIGSHMGKWDFFWKYFFEEVLTPNFPGVPVVFLGKDAQALKKYVFEMAHPVYKLDHPSYAEKQGIVWDTQKTFTKVNNQLQANRIYWRYSDWKALTNDLPF